MVTLNRKGNDMEANKNKIMQIAGLRGITAFLIAYVLHWTLLFGAVPEFHNSLAEYLFGVSCPLIFLSPNLFFLLSGYLIHQSYYKRIADKKISFKNFILPKIKKIYPMVIVTAIITFILQNIGFLLYGEYFLHADGGEIRNSVFSLLLSFLGMQSGYLSDNDAMSVNGPAWFVSILFLCYGIYFFVTSMLKRKWLQEVAYFFIVILGGFLIIDAPGIPFLYVVNGRGYLSFFLGVLIREFVHLIENLKVTDKISGYIKDMVYIVALVICGCSFYFCCIRTNDILFEDLVLSFMFWPALMYIVIHGHILSRLLSLKGFVLLGELAMPIFLCNFPTDICIRMCDVCFGLNLNYKNPWFWFLHIIISLIIATVFHMIFEKSWKSKKYKVERLVTWDVN